MNIRPYKLITVCGATVVVLGLTAQAASAAPAAPDTFSRYLPHDSVLLHATPVPNSELAGMRGRFVEGNRISYFGLTLVSTLRNATKTITGRWSMDADLSGKSPVVDIESNTNIKSHSQASGGSSNASAKIISKNGGGGSSRNFHGTFQTVQTAGDYNRGVNVFDVHVADAKSLNHPPVKHTGSNAGAIHQQMGIDLQLKTSQVRQTINANRGLRQAIRLNGSGMTGTNLARLAVGLSRTSHEAGEMGGVAAAVRSLRNLPR